MMLSMNRFPAGRPTPGFAREQGEGLPDRDPHEGVTYPLDALLTEDAEGKHGLRHAQGPAEPQDRPARAPVGASARVPDARSERQVRTDQLAGMILELIDVKDRILPLEARQKELTEEIKQRLLAGDRAQAAGKRAILRANKRRTVHYGAFLRQFGPALTLKAATIDLRIADELARTGELSIVELKRLVVYAENAPALHLVDVRREP